MKTKYSFKNTKKAAKYGDQIFSKLIKKFEQFKTETEIAKFIKQETQNKKCKLAFPTIVASGSNGAQPHHKPKKELNKGFCVIDFGIKYSGYCSDMTRTIFIGKPTQKEKEYYKLVLTAQIKAIKGAKPGMTGSEVDRLARKEFGSRKKHFIHKLGHGLGKKVHELPKIGKNDDNIIEEGMIITIEPGIYYKNKFGIRIEDDFIVTKNGLKAITKSTKKLLTFPALK